MPHTVAAVLKGGINGGKEPVRSPLDTQAGPTDAHGSVGLRIILTTS